MTEPMGTGVAMRVTPETFIRAETDRMFSDVVRAAGGVNKFMHFRRVTPLDKQTVIRMNRDTLYSMAVVDTSQGATITVPDFPDRRYFSVYLVDNDHYVPFVIYEPGTHELPRDTRYLGVGVRIQLQQFSDADEIALVNRLQDQFVISAPCREPFQAPQWDKASLDALRAQYEEESAGLTSWNGTQGPRGKVNEATRHLAAAAAWGLFPEWDAMYLNYSGDHDANVCHKATYQVPENDAFWSITVYGKDGYMKRDNNIINSTNAVFNADGTFTVFFGPPDSCGDVPNRLDVSEGWNFLMRIYRPGPSVLDGSYTLPAATPA